jgi:hypothetical protein
MCRSRVHIGEYKPKLQNLFSKFPRKPGIRVEIMPYEMLWHIPRVQLVPEVQGYCYEFMG